GNTVIYVRGGDHDSNWPAEGGVQPDPSSSPIQPKVQIFAVSVSDGAPRLLADGDEAVVSPKGDRIAFTREKQIWVIPTNAPAPEPGSLKPAGRRMFFARGESTDPQWSPDGSKLAFVSQRGDHNFIGVFTNDSTPILWLAPSTSH